MTNIDLDVIASELMWDAILSSVPDQPVAPRIAADLQRPELIIVPRLDLAAQLGVTTMLRTAVVGVDPDGVTLRREGKSEYLPARTVVWAAGVRASGLAGELASAAGAKPDSAGRVTVERDLTLQGHPEVIALGDMVRMPRCAAAG